jgi:hypothetical protein
MKLTPLLFKAEMIRALLDGSKTQTRRVVKGNVPLGCENSPILLERCPYGQVGDQIWAKETWRTWARFDHLKPSEIWDGVTIEYAAGGNNRAAVTQNHLPLMSKKWRSPLFMRRCFSRITLEITNVRVERLNDISDADAKAEGADGLIADNCTEEDKDFLDLPLYEIGNPYRNGYALLWDSINGDRAWDKNPWVWVIEFKVVKL